MRRGPYVAPMLIVFDIFWQPAQLGSSCGMTAENRKELNHQSAYLYVIIFAIEILLQILTIGLPAYLSMIVSCN